MQTALMLVCVFFLVVTVGSVAPGTARIVRPVPASPSSYSLTAEDPQLSAMLLEGKQLAQAEQYAAAERLLERGFQQARQREDTPRAIQFLVSLSNIHFATFQYRRAMAGYEEARRMATAIADWETCGILGINISSLYYQMGAVEEALQASQLALVVLPPQSQSKLRPTLLYLQAKCSGAKGGMAHAAPLYLRAIEEAGQQGDLATQAAAWEQLGFEYLRRQDLARAEPSLLEAFRLRKMAKLTIPPLSYRNLGMLMFAQGDHASAARFLNQAIAAANQRISHVPSWSLYFRRAQVRKTLGDLEGALSDTETALESIRDWRLALLAVDSVRAGAGAELQQVYSLFIDVGNTLYFRTKNQHLASETFEVAEENRAASLRQTLGIAAELSRLLPPDYWESLAELQSATSALLHRDSPALRRRVQLLRLQLTETEARAGLQLDKQGRSDPQFLHPASLESVQRSLRPSETLFSFHLGDTSSYLWAVSATGFDLCRLPARQSLSAKVAAFNQAVSGSLDDAASIGADLYTALFGEVKPEFLRNPQWVLVLDDALFDLPFAALVQHTAGGKPAFLVESHSLRVLPSAAMLASAPPAHWNGPLLGIGDPIYNTADPRWTRADRGIELWKDFLELFPGASTGDTAEQSLQLARLPGSARELKACADAWRTDSQFPVLLTGEEASLDHFKAALSRKPAVIHFATHMIPSPQRPREALIAFALRPGRKSEFLSSESVARLRVNSRLVVMSGCSSGSGDVLPGEGVWGLTRAWLLAGAHAVAATRWPTPDDSGMLLESFYTHLRTSSPRRFPISPSKALQMAQIEMLHSGTWRSEPRFWAAYFIVGKD